MTALALRSRTVVVLTILIFAVCGANAPSEPRRRFEYKLSFKGPLLVQRDGSIPFWTHGGREYSCPFLVSSWLTSVNNRFFMPYGNRLLPRDTLVAVAAVKTNL